MTARSRAALRGVAAVIVASLGVSGVARAQFRATVDVGGASIRYGDSVRATATTVAPTVRLDNGPLTAVAAGSFSALGGAWTSQGGIAASLLSRPFGAGRIEVVGAGGGTMHQDGTQTGQYLGRVRLHATGATRGLWIGAGAGRAWDGSLWNAAVEGELAAWAQRNDLTALGTVRPASIGDSLRFTDFTATVRRDAMRLEVAASAGVRSGVASLRGSPNGWGSISAAMWVAPQLALVADGGSYPADLNQRFPGGTYLSLGVRLAPRRRTWARARAISAREVGTARTGEGATARARIEVVSVGAGSYAVRIHAPGARRVEIIGDFTDWQSMEFAPAANSWWTIVTRITPGVRQMNVRIDGGRWMVPAGATVEEDEFGAPVGVIVVR